MLRVADDADPSSDLGKFCSVWCMFAHIALTAFALLHGPVLIGPALHVTR